MGNRWNSFKFTVKDWWASSGEARPYDDGLSRTIRDATHVRGIAGDISNGLGGTNQSIIEQAVDGHEAYQKSFKKDS